jgi:hypothetical protein
MGMVVKSIGKDEIMRYADLYTKVILTVIAGLLAWNTLARFHVPAVHAQGTSPQYAVEEITAGGTTQSLEAAINRAAKGRQLVSMIPWGLTGTIYMVASSAEFVGRFWLWESSQVVI